MKDFRFSVAASIAAFSCLFCLIGCSPADQPKVVRAKNGIYTDLSKNSKKDRVSLETVKQEGQKKRDEMRQRAESSPKIDTSLTGTAFVCAQYTDHSVFWLSHGAKGQVSRSSGSVPGGDTTSLSGIRWNIGLESSEAARTGFKFEGAQGAALYRLDQSNGGSAEIFLDEEKKPVMTCFKKLDTSFLWTSRALLGVSTAMVGSWSCEGPLGRLKIGSEGETLSVMGPSQAFLWSKGNETMMTMMTSPEKSIPGKMDYNSFLEFRLKTPEISQGKWSYDSLDDPNDPAKSGNCTKASS